MAGAPTGQQLLIDQWWAWAQGVLNGIGAPTTPTNYQTLWNWSLKESGPTPILNGSIHNNPLNTTQHEPGSVSSNKVGVQSYPDVSTGVLATQQTLLNGRYPDIVNALRNSVPTSQWGSNGSIVSQLGVWGSGANWLGWTNKPPTPSSNFQASASANSSSNPLTDAASAALNSALGPVGTAITSGVQKVVWVLLMAAGAGLMLGGLALLAVTALKSAPAPVRQFAAGTGRVVSRVTPAGRAVSAARSRVPPARPAPAARPAPPSKPPPSAEPEYRAGGRTLEMSPVARAALRRRQAEEQAS